MPISTASNLAPRVACPIIVNIGQQDSTCPPETGYALFRAIGSEDKRLYDYDGHGHDANNAVQPGLMIPSWPSTFSPKLKPK